MWTLRRKQDQGGQLDTVAVDDVVMSVLVDVLRAQLQLQLIRNAVYKHTADSSCSLLFLNVQTKYYLEVLPPHISQKNSCNRVAHSKEKF